ncbi:putative DNA-cytosine methylase [Aeromonas phage AVP3]
MGREITYGSGCSGIEAASAAWEGLDFTPMWFSQFDPEHDYSKGPDFPSALLEQRYPHVNNLGDFTRVRAYVAIDGDAPEVLVAGTPCQAFSVAGLRGGVTDSRGQLTLEFIKLANEIDDVRYEQGKSPCVLLWENVTGVLSMPDNAFGHLLGGLVGEDGALEPGPRPQQGRSSAHWRWDKKTHQHIPRWPVAGVVVGPQRAVGWRVLDAQFFGVAQRRRRVFLVGSAREGFDPSEVLFEFGGMRRDSEPVREKEAPVAALTANGVGTCGVDDNQGQAGHLIPEVKGFRMVAFGEYTDDETASTMKARDYKDATDLIMAVHGTQDPITNVELAHTLGCNWGQENTVSYSVRTANTSSNGWGIQLELCHTLDTAQGVAVSYDMAVRRLMPIECERLQGFRDDYTLVTYNGKPVADSHRYRALGNSMCVNVMRFLGIRIQQHIYHLDISDELETL